MASFVLFIPSAYPMFSMIFGRSLWVLSASEDWGMFKASGFDIKTYFVLQSYIGYLQLKLFFRYMTHLPIQECL